MNKLLMSTAVAAMFGAMIPAAHAATVNSDFTVSVLLSARCNATNSAALTLDFGTYTALETVAPTHTAAPTVDLTFNCTRGLTAPTLSFDTTNGTVTGDGVLAGVNYTMSAALQASTLGIAATGAAGSGTAATRTYRVTGGMVAGQAGQCATTTSTAANCNAAAQTHTRTLIVTY